jgi:heme exporter protein C
MSAHIIRLTSARTRRLLGIGAAAGLVLLAWLALAVAPEDTVQGPPQRIFYVHVPSAWIGFLALGVVFAASIAYLRTRNPVYDDIAGASGAVGAVFITGVLVTGPLWARPAWGVFWVWDPRLTSFFVLWLLAASYLTLRRQVTEPGRRARYSAVLGIVGFLDVPVVYLSVSWWRGLHPAQVVITRDGPQMPAAMLATLAVGLVAFTALFLYLTALRIHIGQLTESVRDREEIS